MKHRLERLLRLGELPPPLHSVSTIRCETTWVVMRDGVRLATDIYLPPTLPAPVIAMRTPYGRGGESYGYAAALYSFTRRGYAVVAQDCRGTGGSEPDSWDYYMHEVEDSYDLIEWITRQPWFGGFIGSVGGSYVGQMQWCMATHPAMSAISPSMSGLGVAINTAHLYMFLNAYARSVGKGEDKVAVHFTEMERFFEKDTLAGGYFNEPLHLPFSEALLARFPKLRSLRPDDAKRWLWEHYCAMTGAQRTVFLKDALGIKSVTSTDVESLSALFGHRISHDALTIPKPTPSAVCRAIEAPPLFRTGWYDWGLNDALATWEAIRRDARPDVAIRARLIISPYAHNSPGYREGSAAHPELLRTPNVVDAVGLLLEWYAAVREDRVDAWPTVLYYLMGANEWRSATDWPVPEAVPRTFYLGCDGALANSASTPNGGPDHYTYDPRDPTPTVGGSIVSFVYTPGSVDVSDVQKRADVLVYTTPPLEHDLDVVGPLRAVIYASSSAPDTDFVARLSDVFPDGRAIQLQNGILRTRYRDPSGEPRLMEPGRIYRLEIDLWATANRFKAGHQLRLDISSADFPRFDRNTNLGGTPGDPMPARQTVYHDRDHASYLLVHALP